MLGAQASHADVQFLLFAIDDQRCLADVEIPLPIGMALGVTHTMTELRYFPAKVALVSQRFVLL